MKGLSRKLIIGLTCLICLQVWNFVALNLNQEASQQELAYIKNEKLEALTLINELRFSLRSINELYGISILLSDLDLVEESSRSVKNLKVKVEALMKEEGAHKKSLVILLEKVKRYLSEVGGTYKLYIENPENEEYSKRTFEIGQNYNALTKGLNELVEATNVALDKAFFTFKRDSEEHHFNSNLIHVVSILILIYFGIYLHGSLIGRLKNLLNHLIALKSKDEVPLLKTKNDEIGEIEKQIVSIHQQLISAKLSAEEANVAKANFLSNMNHELKTPLNGIMGMAEVMQMSSLDDSQKQCSDIILRSSKLLLNVFNDILEMSKLSVGYVAQTPEATSINEVFEDIDKILYHSIQTKGGDLSLEFNVEDSVPEACWLDIRSIQQVMLSLIGNSIKFSDSGVISVNAKVKETESQLTLHISIQDQGIGIAPDDLSRLFEVFTQADESNTRCYGGAGLGLAISKASVDLMRGKMGAESELGKGSMFWFEVPIKPC